MEREKRKIRRIRRIHFLLHGGRSGGKRSGRGWKVSTPPGSHGFTYHPEERRFTKYIGHIDLEARGIRKREYTANELVIEVNRLTRRVRYTAYILAYGRESDLLRSWDLLEGLILGEAE